MTHDPMQSNNNDPDVMSAQPGNIRLVRDSWMQKTCTYSSITAFRAAWARQGLPVAHTEVHEERVSMPNGGFRDESKVTNWLSVAACRNFIHGNPLTLPVQRDALVAALLRLVGESDSVVAAPALEKIQQGAPLPKYVSMDMRMLLFRDMKELVSAMEAPYDSRRIKLFVALVSDLFGIQLPETRRTVGAMAGDEGREACTDYEALLHEVTDEKGSSAGRHVPTLPLPADAPAEYIPRTVPPMQDAPTDTEGSRLNPGQVPVDPHNAAVVPRVDVTGTFTAKEAGLQLRAELDAYRALGRKSPPKPVEDGTYGNLFANVMRELKLHPHRAKDYVPEDKDYSAWCAVAVAKQATLNNGEEGEKSIPMVRFKKAAIDAVRQHISLVCSSSTLHNLPGQVVTCISQT